VESQGTQSVDGGDLRVAHFFGTHAVHFIALFAWSTGCFIDRAGGASRNDLRRTQWVRAFCLAYTGFSIWTFVQAVQGRAFLG